MHGGGSGLTAHQWETPGSTHNDLHATKRWFKVIEEGPDEFVFGAEGNPPLGESEGQVNAEVDCLARSNDNVERNSHQIQGLVDIDDNNLPAPENVPMGNSAFALGPWGHDGTCFRRKQGALAFNARPPNMQSGIAVPDILTLFEALFPILFIKEVMPLKMNESLSTPCTHGEFLVFIGLCF